jgi:mannosylglycerate hydrolase MGH1-like protein
MDDDELLAAAEVTLRGNSRGSWTSPTSTSLYPHQFLWDSCFISIGQRHYDVKRAQEELRSLFHAQWKNGMLPHMIFLEQSSYHAGPGLWHSERSQNAPDGIQTTGITQPPVVAEAVVRVGQKLSAQERHVWYQETYPQLLAYHQWFYRERNPRGDGLPVIVLSWETGLDNTPPWMYIMHRFALSLRAQLIQQANFTSIMERFRKDTAAVPAEERISTIDLYAVYDLVKALRRHRYDSEVIMREHKLQVIDVAFSCILIRANVLLKDIADELGEELPTDIRHAMHVAPHALETLWDTATQHYYNRNALTGQLIKIPTISTFMPLYAGVLPPERVRVLLGQMHDPKTFGTAFPLPSTPIDSPYFEPKRYWQGPTWINTNWLLVDGLRRNGQPAAAEQLRQATLAVVRQAAPTHGFYEYYSPLDGAVAGAPAFSWTAALTIDLLKDAG